MEREAGWIVSHAAKEEAKSKVEEGKAAEEEKADSSALRISSGRLCMRNTYDPRFSSPTRSTTKAKYPRMPKGNTLNTPSSHTMRRARRLLSNMRCRPSILTHQPSLHSPRETGIVLFPGSTLKRSKMGAVSIL